MRMLTLKCPECGANLEVENGLDTFFCKYCGAKIQLDGMGKEAYKAKVRLKEMDHVERIKDKENDQERVRLKYESRTHRIDLIKTLFEKGPSDGWITISLFLLVPLMVIIGFAPSFIHHNRNVSQLKRIEAEVENAINEGDYDTALFKVNQLILADNYSSEETRAWEKKQKAYILIIEEGKEKQARENPNNIFMPASSRNYKGKKAQDIAEELSSLGFTNVSLQRSSEKAGLFHPVATVEHILIGGKTDFLAGDFFEKDEVCIIYYYDK